jgi:hypothetical protein
MRSRYKQNEGYWEEMKNMEVDETMRMEWIKEYNGR